MLICWSKIWRRLSKIVINASASSRGLNTRTGMPMRLIENKVTAVTLKPRAGERKIASALS